MANQITSVTFASRTTDIQFDGSSFVFNKISKVELPDSVESNPTSDFMFQGPYGAEEFSLYVSGDVNVLIEILQSTWLVQLASKNPNIKSSIAIMGTESDIDFDLNGDGDTDDVINMGGHIVNAGSITLNYLSKTNQSLQQSVTMTGELADGTILRNYLANDWQQWPVVAAPWDPTPEEQADLDAILSRYWLVGQQVSFTAPDIPGYITPTPATQTFALTAGETVVDLVYAQPALSSTNPSAPNTGFGTMASQALIVVASGLMTSGLILRKKLR